MTRLHIGLLALLLLLATGFNAAAAEAAPLADDVAVEVRLVGIADELRCLVCQNESLAGSRAALAEDLRREIRSLIRAGKTDPEILDYLVSRYGDFVRYRPPWKPTTWLLWLGPFMLLAAALALLLNHVRQRRETMAPLSAADRRRAAAILAGEK
ncbi:MAG: cytochrome c-type biogenesis protein [Ideonella sp.]